MSYNSENGRGADRSCEMPTSVDIPLSLYVCLSLMYKHEQWTRKRIGRQQQPSEMDKQYTIHICCIQVDTGKIYSSDLVASSFCSISPNNTQTHTQGVKSPVLLIISQWIHAIGHGNPYLLFFETSLLISPQDRSRHTWRMKSWQRQQGAHMWLYSP